MTWGQATDAQLLDVLNATYVSQGILPLTPKSDALIPTKKSNQYSVRHYVDVKACQPLGAFNLVGNGASYDLCGHIYYDEAKGCLNTREHPEGKIFARLIGATCFRFECPICYQKACAREAGRITRRFERVPKVNGERSRSAEAKAVGTDKTGYLGRPIHLVVSVPEAEAHLVDGETLSHHGGRFKLKSNYSVLRAKANKIATNAGFKGGCCIFHPFANDKMREDPDIEAIYPDVSEGVDLKWLKEYFEKQDRAVGFWYKRPHYHFIGYGWISGTVDIEAETGWVVRNLGVRDSVYYTALYQLSHAGVRKGTQVVTWMGCMSNSTYCKLNPEPEGPRLKETCPECGCYLNPIRWVGEGGALPPWDGLPEGGYLFPARGWRYLAPGERNHSCLVRGSSHQ